MTNFAIGTPSSYGHRQLLLRNSSPTREVEFFLTGDDGEPVVIEKSHPPPTTLASRHVTSSVGDSNNFDDDDGDSDSRSVDFDDFEFDESSLFEYEFKSDSRSSYDTRYDDDDDDVIDDVCGSGGGALDADEDAHMLSFSQLRRRLGDDVTDFCVADESSSPSRDSSLPITIAPRSSSSSSGAKMAGNARGAARATRPTDGGGGDIYAEMRALSRDSCGSRDTTRIFGELPTKQTRRLSSHGPFGH